MTQRRIALATAAAALFALAGCSSSGKSNATAGSSHPHTSPVTASSVTTTSASAGSASTPAATATLSTDQCLELAEAQLNVATAMKADEARKAADIVEKYNPPSDVKTAVEHFVTTIGVQFNDPQAAHGTAILKAWVDNVCPT